MEWIGILIAFTLTGALIGQMKGCVLFGALLGFLLGSRGWLIPALMSSNKPKCPFCKGILNADAVKCHHCASDLNAGDRHTKQYDITQCKAEKERRGIINE